MPERATLRIRLTPRARRDEIAGWEGGTLKARVAAPPAEGRANEALLKLLAAALGVPKRDVAIVSGAQSRDKTVRVDGLTLEEVRSRLGAPLL